MDDAEGDGGAQAEVARLLAAAHADIARLMAGDETVHQRDRERLDAVMPHAHRGLVRDELFLSRAPFALSGGSQPHESVRSCDVVGHESVRSTLTLTRV